MNDLKNDLDRERQRLIELIRSIENGNRAEEFSDPSDDQSDICSLLDRLEENYERAGLVDEAIETHRRRLELELEKLSGVIVSPYADADRSRGLRLFYFKLSKHNRAEEAASIREQLIELYAQVYFDEPIETIALLVDAVNRIELELVPKLRERGQIFRSELLHSQTNEFAVNQFFYDSKSRNAIAAIDRLSSLMREALCFREALALDRKCLELSRELSGEDHPLTRRAILSSIKAHHALIAALETIGKRDEIDPLRAETSKLYATLFDASDRTKLETLVECMQAIFNIARKLRHDDQFEANELEKRLHVLMNALAKSINNGDRIEVDEFSKDALELFAAFEHRYNFF